MRDYRKGSGWSGKVRRMGMVAIFGLSRKDCEVLDGKGGEGRKEVSKPLAKVSGDPTMTERVN
jgi:hypothetical protein